MSPRDADKNATCNVDLQQNCLSAKKYNVAYVRSLESNRFKVNFGSESDGARLCDIACTQVRIRNNKLLPKIRSGISEIPHFVGFISDLDKL